jgi:AcrR family transcriptional regulator
MTFQRARSPEHKQQRRAAILAAAATVAATRGVQRTTLGGVAAEIGMAKSALLKHFETREEIFLSLTAQEWQAWVDDVVAALARLRKPSPASVARVLVTTLEARPLLCDLLSQMASVLERNVSLDAALAFKRGAGVRNDAVAAAIERALPDADGTLVIETAIVLTAGLWPMAHPAPTLAEALAADPSLERHQGHFAQRTRATLEAVMRGSRAGVM